MDETYKFLSRKFIYTKYNGELYHTYITLFILTLAFLAYLLACVNPYAAGWWFGQYKVMQKTWKITETLANGYSYESIQQELSNEYQHDRV